jgi:hypothetical protein
MSRIAAAARTADRIDYWIRRHVILHSQGTYPSQSQWNARPLTRSPPRRFEQRRRHVEAKPADDHIALCPPKFDLHTFPAKTFLNAHPLQTNGITVTAPSDQQPLERVALSLRTDWRRSPSLRAYSRPTPGTAPAGACQRPVRARSLFRGLRKDI